MGGDAVVILLPIALLAVALAAFVLGFSRGSLLLDYVSIGASAVSFAIVLVLMRFSRATRSRAPAPPPPVALPEDPAPPTAEDTATGWDPGADGHEAEAPGGEEGLVWSPALPLPHGPDHDRPAVPTPEAAHAPEVAHAPEGPGAEEPAAEPRAPVRHGFAPYQPPVWTPPGEEQASPGAQPFPIADYDQLRISEIMSLLPQLEPDELEAVRAREQAGGGRSIILRRLDDLTGKTTPAHGGVGGARPPDEGRWTPAEVPQPPAPGVSSPPPRGATPDRGPQPSRQAAPAGEAGSAEFPIADYDELLVAQIIPLLDELDPDELEMVQAREQAGARRTTVLRRIAILLPAGQASSGY